MHLIRRPAAALLLALLLAVPLARAGFGPFAQPVEFARLDLTDGRTLRNVRVQSYDPTTDRIVVVVDRTAALLPMSVVPRPAQDLIRKQAAQTPSEPSAPANSATQPAEPTPAPPIPAINGENGESEQAREAATVARHRAIALKRAEQYFRFEFPMGSNSIKVTALDFDAKPTRAVPGWTGRYETAGKVFLEYYDGPSRTFQRMTGEFSVTTEQQPNGDIKVVDISKRF